MVLKYTSELDTVADNNASKYITTGIFANGWKTSVLAHEYLGCWNDIT